MCSNFTSTAVLMGVLETATAGLVVLFTAPDGVSVDTQLLSIFNVMKLHHDLKFNLTYIFSHFLIRDGNRQLLIISLLFDV